MVRQFEQTDRNESARQISLDQQFEEQETVGQRLERCQSGLAGAEYDNHGGLPTILQQRRRFPLCSRCGEAETILGE